MPTLELLFLSSEDADLPHPPIAHVYLTTEARAEYDHPSKGAILLTPDAYGIREFEGYITQLIRELEEIREEARKRFAAEKAGRHKG
jgi:hypothetical protein